MATFLCGFRDNEGERVESPVGRAEQQLVGTLERGGDPTGTGKGGTSIYGRQFDDEIHEELKHTGKFIVSSSMILICLIERVSDFLRVTLTPTISACI
uniref:peptidylprolyl isomerase n=1 Tax=Timema douglasi TaxID=61478 RepID=A0A7R8VCL5_TIMDO|nr:unnamed protein product [Timema douglasi]